MKLFTIEGRNPSGYIVVTNNISNTLVYFKSKEMAEQYIETYSHMYENINKELKSHGMYIIFINLSIYLYSANNRLISQFDTLDGLDSYLHTNLNLKKNTNSVEYLQTVYECTITYNQYTNNWAFSSGPFKNIYSTKSYSDLIEFIKQYKFPKEDISMNVSDDIVEDSDYDSLYLEGKEVEEEEKVSKIDSSNLDKGYKDTLTNPKPMLDLISPEIIFGLGRVLQYGAKKYAPRNWEKGLPYSVIYGALQRHLWAWWGGENIDSESGLSHLDHAAFGIMVLMAYEGRKNASLDKEKYINLDDRHNI